MQIINNSFTASLKTIIRIATSICSENIWEYKKNISITESWINESKIEKIIDGQTDKVGIIIFKQINCRTFKIL